MIKVVHVNYSDTEGGASIAAFRHHEAMNIQHFVESEMLVVYKQKKNDKSIISIIKSRMDKIRMLLYYTFSAKMVEYSSSSTFFSFLPIGFDLSKEDCIQKADVIYIHWVNSMTTSVKGIEKILKLKKPTYLFLHDMWSFTGGCHYSMQCNRYKDSGCYSCPVIKPFLRINISSLQYKMKQRWKMYPNLHVLVPSNWLYQCAESSNLFRKHSIYLCRNTIDINFFKPHNKEFCRSFFRVKQGKQVLIFAAASIDNPVKGLNYLLECLNALEQEKYECLILGDRDETLSEKVNLPIHFTGYLHDSYSLVLAYNAADLLIIPSVAENFPNVVLEAMSCGTPAVGFNVGGIPELILHKETGYIADDYTSKGLLKGVKWCLDWNNYYRIAKKARETVCMNYSYDKISNLHNFLTPQKQ